MDIRREPDDTLCKTNLSWVMASHPYILYLRLVQMEEMQVEPRVLADDLHIAVVGENAMRKFEDAFDKTHLHLIDMGARVSPGKCTTFA